MTRVLTLMGSGETSPTMVKTHRELLERIDGGAVLLDTPFGFQSNADELTARARQYFSESVGRALEVASFRSSDDIGSVSYERALDLIRGAGYVFAGPGSPTYALRQWQSSLVPALLVEKLSSGGCVTFASAAALTLGVVTVPVYEIYKVGAEPVWEEGLDVLGDATGLRAAVIPHFNNAEGGTHDTRYCYLGESRLAVMERSLPDGAFVLGIDEHTGLVLDLDRGAGTVVGVGSVTARWPDGATAIWTSGETVTIEHLSAHPQGTSVVAPTSPAAHAASATAGAPDGARPTESPLNDEVRAAEAAFATAVDARDVDAAVQVVLDLEAEIHRWANETFSSDEMDRARAVLRSMIVRLGAVAATGARDPRAVIAPFVDALLDVRRSARAARRFDDADSVRDRLVEIGVEVRDTPDGTEWGLRGGLVP
ncbi:MAG TPA: hypothetical protein VM345_01625 [Acidimicrobiales bacterium]|jgi:hypothetical protein|nr:hypothetical protein [Acidimicrobiales bacterium]